jgi:hypothetical protein
VGQAQADFIDYAWSGFNLPTGQFGTLNLQTGVFTQTGTLPGGIIGGDMARLPGGPLYAMTFSTSDLILINPLTTQITTVGHSGNGILGIAFRQDSTLFGFTYQDMYRIDPTTGAATLIGHMGNFVSTNSSFDVRFDANGNLFLVEQNGAPTSSLYSVNVSTGLATLVGPTGFPVNALDFENGTLYGFTENGKIISINTLTGAGTFLVNESGMTAAFINAVATADPGPVSTVPEPSSLILLGVGAVCVLGYGRRQRKQAEA